MVDLYEVSWIVQRYLDKELESFGWEAPWSHGSIQFGERIAAVAIYCLDRWPGDIAEIGCFTGATTRNLAFLAQRRGRRVIAIDPWEKGTQNCEGWEYEVFQENMEGVRDVVDELRLRSQDPRAIKELHARELCFALVDGLHEYEPCLSDLRAVEHAKVIAVDDILWNKSVDNAFRKGENVGFRLVTNPLMKEGYLVT